MSYQPGPPEDEASLLARAQDLAGLTLETLAARAGMPMPADLKRDKGWVGMLLSGILVPAQAAKRSRTLPIWVSN